ncbi:hypothetical protein OESDEN_08209 [Oesophagostomum dentatum]|uniref:Uncharacterized protein n=1 Tax=Oesophagostomum dentatum TaxID=61180 RepID=A0A0B1T7X4_OESDE|nr:hypothetical protein OESDEN_08209 [Oesophagostomum dentatum]
MEYEGRFYSEQYCRENGVQKAGNVLFRVNAFAKATISAVSLVLAPFVWIKYRNSLLRIKVRLLLCNLLVSCFLYALLRVLMQVFLYS